MNDHPADMNAKPGQAKKARRLQMVASMDELRREKWVPFTLGPLYLLGQLDFDVVARFLAECKPDMAHQYIDFMDFRIFDLPNVMVERSGGVQEEIPYAHRIFVMNDEAYPAFVEYLQTVEVIDRENKRYFQIARFGAAILDPFTRYLNTTVPKPETIDVWTVIGLGGMLVPKTHVEQLPYPIFKEGEAEDLSREEFLKRLPRPATAPLVVEFEKKPTSPEIVNRGLKILGEVS